MKKAKVLVLMLALVLTLGMMTACSGDNGGNGDGKASAKVILVLEDGSEVPYDIEVTEGVSLREGLYEAGLIDDENHVGMFVTTIDGHTADALTDGVTWLPTDKDGNELEDEIDVEAMCMLDFIAVNDGDEIYLQYYTVPNFED